MKFIVDAQISKLISDYLCSQNHDCIHTLQLPKKSPPRLVLIKTGNIENSLLLSILKKHLQQMCNELLLHPLIELTRTEMIIHQ